MIMFMNPWCSFPYQSKASLTKTLSNFSLEKFGKLERCLRLRALVSNSEDLGSVTRNPCDMTHLFVFPVLLSCPLLASKSTCMQMVYTNSCRYTHKQKRTSTSSTQRNLMLPIWFIKNKLGPLILCFNWSIICTLERLLRIQMWLRC